MARFKWTPAADAMLARCAREKRSASYAGRLIGCDRNAAAYRAKVLGLSFNAEAGRPAAPKPRAEIKPARARPVPFLEAGPRQCAWPMLKRDEPGTQMMLVCGAPLAPSARGPGGRVHHCYCERHHKRSRRPAASYAVGYEAAMQTRAPEVFE